MLPLGLVLVKELMMIKAPKLKWWRAHGQQIVSELESQFSFFFQKKKKVAKHAYDCQWT